jgi:broad specificity phosphatase PhoE
MHILVIRHGETDMNKDDRLQGPRGEDLGLNTTGMSVVTELRDSLLLIPTVMYVSPTRRTRETAEILNSRFHVPIVHTPLITERDFGSLAGKKRSEVDPKIVESDLEGAYDYRPYGGECVDDVKKRVHAFLDELRIEKGGLPMLVTHRGIVRILYDMYPDHVFGSAVTPGSKHVFDIPD